MRTVFVLILLASLLSSCAKVSFRSRSSQKIEMGKNPQHTKLFKFEYAKSYYLWGLFPANNMIYINDLIMDEGLTEVSKLSIREITSFWQMVLSFASLGMYIPKNFEFSGITK